MHTTLKFRKLNNKESAANNNIPNIYLKNLPTNIITFYIILFNNMLNWGYFPDCWKRAKIIPSLKKGKDNSEPSSYKPISLLSNIGKVYEKLINDILLSISLNKNIIPENQFGFRRSHSTIYPLNKLTSDINWVLNGGACVGAFLVDLEKAFNTVWLNELIVRLKRKGFPSAVI